MKKYALLLFVVLLLSTASWGSVIGLTYPRTSLIGPATPYGCSTLGTCSNLPLATTMSLNSGLNTCSMLGACSTLGMTSTLGLCGASNLSSLGTSCLVGNPCLVANPCGNSLIGCSPNLCQPTCGLLPNICQGGTSSNAVVTYNGVSFCTDGTSSGSVFLDWSSAINNDPQ